MSGGRVEESQATLEMRQTRGYTQDVPEKGWRFGGDARRTEVWMYIFSQNVFRLPNNMNARGYNGRPYYSRTIGLDIFSSVILWFKSKKSSMVSQALGFSVVLYSQVTAIPIPLRVPNLMHNSKRSGDPGIKREEL